MKTLVIGVGNPILGDDGAGIYAAEIVAEAVGSNPDLQVKMVSTGGLRLLEEVLGYDRVILIDGTVSGEQIGKIRKIALADLSDTTHLTSAHDLSFSTACELGNMLSHEWMPSEIEIYTIEIQRTTVFTDGLSPVVKKAAHSVSKMILQSLTKN